ncbi:MAG TPA: sulfatase-like hydrolase/transferase [Polyangia bacterium]|nr:sulfatase-like hydrolase/transferase [Polyangia bacterium]
MARVIRRALGSGPGAGAIALALFFGLDFVGATLDFMGFSDAKATSRIVHRYGPQIARDQLSILGTYLVMGAIFGGVGALLGAWWDRARWQTSTTRVRVLRGVAAALVGHAFFFVRSVVHYPQLYSEAFYDRGGVRRALMVWLTEHATATILDALLAVLLVGLVAGPLVTSAGRTLARRWLDAAVRLRPLRWATLGALLLVVAVVGLAAHRHHPGHAGRRPNILLIAVDSLRADRVFSPDEAKRFPTLAKLAARGVRFREAHVTVPRTFPSFVTLLTGRYPHHHGIRHMFPSAAQRAAIGPALPAALHAAGYRTSVISDYAGEIFSRTPMGFDHVDVPFFDMKTIVAQRGLQVHPNVLPYATSSLGRRLFPAVAAMPELSDPARLADRAIAALDDTDGQPLFLTVFFSAAHFPYASPDPYYRRFGAHDYAGPYRYQKPPLAPAPATEADRTQIRALYDGAVAATDAAIARILDRLDRDGLGDDTIVVLLADHGENLYDLPERGMGHGDHLRGSAADHVPWVWIDPHDHLAAHDVPGIVRDVDFVPTLAHLVGVKPPPTDGVDLGPLLRGERPSLGLDAYQETELWFVANGPGFEPDERIPYPTITGVTDLAPDDDIYLRPEWQDTVIVGKHRAIRTERWKLLYRPTRGGVRWSLYDLAADPDERTDVLAAHPDVAATLRGKLQHWMLEDKRMTLRGDFLVPR